MTTATTRTPADFLVKGLENVEPAYAEFPGTMYAGLLPASHGIRIGETMFWLFEPHTQSVPDTLVIWLNGGPGCSSFNCGVMMEHSPVTQPLRPAGYCCLTDTTPKLAYNEYTWTKATTMLYVEHPIGTGFSFGEPLPETEAEASADLDQFLQNFFTVFAKFQSYDFYVMGESYAGMFVPSVARTIYLNNKAAMDNNNNESKRIIVNLKGAALGNGWIEPEVQGPATIDYSWWHGMIDAPTRDSLHAEWENCMSGHGTTLNPPPFHPFTVQDDCGLMWGVLKAAGNNNAYDVTTWDPNVDQVTFTSEAFYNRPDVKEYLHAPTNITWHGCRWGEGRRLQQHADQRKLYMDNDRPLSVVPYMAELLDAGIPLLVYNGDRDMTTNMVGTELALNAMEWSGKDEWLDTKRGLWMTNNYESGWAKELGPLSFVVVYNSGHMVPYNQPKPGLDLVTRFLKHKSFVDNELPTVRVVKATTTDNHNHKAFHHDGDKIDGHITHNTLIMGKEQSPMGYAEQSSHMPRLMGGSDTHTAGIVIVSMLVGFVLVLVMGRRNNHRTEYEPVPNVN